MLVVFCGDITVLCYHQTVTRHVAFTCETGKPLKKDQTLLGAKEVRIPRGTRGGSTHRTVPRTSPFDTRDAATA